MGRPMTPSPMKPTVSVMQATLARPPALQRFARFRLTGRFSVKPRDRRAAVDRGWLFAAAARVFGPDFRARVEVFVEPLAVAVADLAGRRPPLREPLVARVRDFGRGDRGAEAEGLRLTAGLVGAGATCCSRSAGASDGASASGAADTSGCGAVCCRIHGGCGFS